MDNRVSSTRTYRHGRWNQKNNEKRSISRREWHNTCLLRI